MDIVILNTSRLRVAIDKYVKKNNERSMTDCFKRNNLNSSVLAKSENRFVSTYRHDGNSELETRISNLEEKYIDLAKIVEELRRKGE